MFVNNRLTNSARSLPTKIAQIMHNFKFKLQLLLDLSALDLNTRLKLDSDFKMLVSCSRKKNKRLGARIEKRNHS